MLYNKNLFREYPDSMSLTDVAHALGVSTKTASNMIRRGDLYAVSVRGRNYIPKSKLIEFLTTAIIDRKSPWHKEMIEKYLNRKSGKT